ncbi:MAG: MBL fold metallo-hydrolase [Ruminococcus sp.]|nr:MBL fold metallo-hydrolase [Ruminococcus sp.]MDY2855574.1 MBL fold metallo-hydrolase [Oscillospiraceae bacterium]
MITVQSVPVGALQVNCYMLKDSNTGFIAVVDPGDNCTALEKLVEHEKENIKYILLTHGHFDHIGYAQALKEQTNAKLVISKAEEPLLSDNNLNLSMAFFGTGVPKTVADITLEDNDTLMLGDSKVTFISTPGHTKGSGCYIIDNNIFTGDTLMKLSMGRTDFPTGSDDDMKASLKRLAALQENYNVYPGHGDYSTLNYEKSCNPYL